MTTLKITFDDGDLRRMTLNELLSKREWSPRERDRLELVEIGMVRRMSTDLDGRPCDVELAR